MVSPLIESLCTVSPAYAILPKTDLLSASISSLTWTSLSNLGAEWYGDEAENLVRFWPSFGTELNWTVMSLSESLCTISLGYEILLKIDLGCASVSSLTCTSLSNLRVGRGGDEVEILVRFWTSFMVLSLIVSVCTTSLAYDILPRADCLHASLSSLTCTSVSNLRAGRNGDEVDLVRFPASSGVSPLAVSVYNFPPDDTLCKTDLVRASVSSSTCTSLSNLRAERDGDKVENLVRTIPGSSLLSCISFPWCLGDTKFLLSTPSSFLFRGKYFSLRGLMTVSLAIDSTCITSSELDDFWKFTGGKEDLGSIDMPSSLMLVFSSRWREEDREAQVSVCMASPGSCLSSQTLPLVFSWRSVRLCVSIIGDSACGGGNFVILIMYLSPSGVSDLRYGRVRKEEQMLFNLVASSLSSLCTIFFCFFILHCDSLVSYLCESGNSFAFWCTDIGSTLSS